MNQHKKMAQVRVPEPKRTDLIMIGNHRQRVANFSNYTRLYATLQAPKNIKIQLNIQDLEMSRKPMSTAQQRLLNRLKNQLPEDRRGEIKTQLGLFVTLGQSYTMYEASRLIKFSLLAIEYPDLSIRELIMRGKRQ